MSRGTRNHVHALVDQLAPIQLAALETILQSIIDPLPRKLALAPIDDERTFQGRRKVARPDESLVEQDPYWRSAMRQYWILLFLLTSLLGNAQVIVDTVAGGNIPSGVQAQSVGLGFLVGVTRDSAGNTLLCDSQLNIIRRILPDGIIQTIAGTGISGYSGDGGPAKLAALNQPSYCTLTASGNLVFADIANRRIRQIDSSSIITTLAGTGIPGTQGESGPSTAAQIGFVTGLAADIAGNVYFSEREQNRIRRITPAGKLENIAGIEQSGFPRSTGDGGPALSAELSSPRLLAIDGAGNLYVVDNMTTVRKISPAGIISTAAGNEQPSSQLGSGDGSLATNASFYPISGLATDLAGNLFIAERSELPRARIRRVDSSGVVSSVAGSGSISDTAVDGPALAVALSDASSLFADSRGNVWFLDNFQVRKLSAQSITTIAGGIPSAAPDNIAGRDAWLLDPLSIAFGPAGDLYIGEARNCSIRKLSRAGTLSSVPGTGNCSTGLPIRPSSIAVDSQGRVYVSDGSNLFNRDHIYSISPQGEVAPLAKGGPGQLTGGKIAVDSKDRLYIAEFSQTVTRVAPGAPPEQYVGLVGRFRLLFYQLGAIALDVADNLYLTENAGGEGRITRITSGGAVSAVKPGASFPNSLAVDAAGNIFETESSSTGFLAAGPALRYKPLQGSGYQGDGGPLASAQFNGASGVAVSPDGTVYINDRLNRRIRKISGAPPASVPVISAAGIVSAASLTSGPIAPGELVSIFGTNLGPASLQTFALKNNKIPTVLGNVRVFIGSGEAAITAVSATQINAFVPYFIAGRESVSVVVDLDGVQSQSITIPVASTSVGLFTTDASGSGQGAILNQDGSYNGTANPAAAGSIVSIYGTGAGVTSPALPDGALVISAPFPTTTQVVSVTISGRDAEVLYVGAAPFLPTGIFQINVRIPGETPSGDPPVSVKVGDGVTAKRVTVSVR